MSSYRMLGSESGNGQRAGFVPPGDCRTITYRVIVCHDPELYRFRSRIDLVGTPEPKTASRHIECCSEKAVPSEPGASVERSPRSAGQSPRSTCGGSSGTAFDP